MFTLFTFFQQVRLAEILGSGSALKDRLMQKYKATILKQVLGQIKHVLSVDLPVDVCNTCG